ncbi:MAG: hypothetical protein KAZ87_08385 [Spirochaetes bacterium]|nr:hypothetical protein [Spirochaetota bacterium]
MMIIFAIGYPLFWNLILRSKIKGKNCFIASYTSILFSNIFTVIEEYYFYALFNALEHICITLGSVLLLAAVLKFTEKNSGNKRESISDEIERGDSL